MKGQRVSGGTVRGVVVTTLVAVVVVCPSAGAESHAPPRVAAAEPLTLQAAIDEVRARHPELAALRARFEADRLRPAAERSLAPPMIEAQAVEWPIDTWNPSHAKLAFMIAQEFPGRGKRDLRVAAAEQEAALSGASISVREQDLVLRVRRAYVDLQLARQTGQVYAESAALLRQMADAAEARYVAGRGAQQDILKAVLERSLLEEQIVMAGERARMAEAALNVLLQRPADAPVGEVEPFRPDLPIPASSDVQRLARENQPELAVIDADLGWREAALAVTRSGRRPDFVVEGGFMVMPNEANAWTARVGLTWPRAPWARDRVDAMEKEGVARIEAIRAERAALENGIRLSVQEAWVRADAAVRRADLLATSVLPQAEHALEVSRVAYQSDRADFLDVLDNERRLIDARLGLLTALAARDTALADLARAVGRDFGAKP